MATGTKVETLRVECPGCGHAFGVEVEVTMEMPDQAQEKDRVRIVLPEGPPTWTPGAA